jgi:hypothetical protein
MPLPKYPVPYEEAWKKLFGLAMKRNQCMEDLCDMVSASKEVSPAEGRLAELDTAEARRILDQIDELTPQVVQALDEFNAQRAKIGRPPLTWENYDMRRFKSLKVMKKKARNKEE